MLSPSSKPKILVSLITQNNDYQRQQAAAAQIAGIRLGAEVQILYADNDAINQVQQLVIAIQSKHPPDAIICEPVGTGALQVAKAAVAAGIGWAILNREVEYIGNLRGTGRAPIFSVSANQLQVGRVQGLQLAKLLPKGGTVLYLEGPSNTSAAQQRTAGMVQTKTDQIHVRTIKGQWTEQSAYAAVNSWLTLSTSHQLNVEVVAAQNDSMALGARNAFDKGTSGKERERWLRLPYTGCDGCPDAGRAWVDQGLLAVTIIIPPNTNVAMEMMVKALDGATLPEVTLTVPVSYPALDVLVPNIERL